MVSTMMLLSLRSACTTPLLYNCSSAETSCTPSSTTRLRDMFWPASLRNDSSVFGRSSNSIPAVDAYRRLPSRFSGAAISRYTAGRCSTIAGVSRLARMIARTAMMLKCVGTRCRYWYSVSNRLETIVVLCPPLNMTLSPHVTPRAVPARTAPLQPCPTIFLTRKSTKETPSSFRPCSSVLSRQASSMSMTFLQTPDSS